MENSFFYFFSATPQVLAAILALFGVFVIYKIQALKDELIIIASEVPKLLESFSFSLLDINEIKRKTAIEAFSDAIQNKNIFFIKDVINSLPRYLDDDSIHKSIANVIIARYNNVFFLHQILFKSTIILSSFTAFVIIACLSIIPFGCYLLTHQGLLNWIFGIIIISVVLCFVGLLIILRIALTRQYIFDKKSKPLS